MIQEQFRALLPRAREATLGLSAGQLNWRPAENAWSVAECIAHLNTTNEKYCISIEKAIAEAREKGWTSVGEPKLGFIERRLLASMDVPVKRRFKTPKALAPPSKAFDRDELLARWASSHERLIELSSQSDGLDLKRARVTSPASSFLKVSLLWAFLAMPAHDRRHLWQIEQICKKISGEPTHLAM
jgi:DinB superfamily